MPRHVFEKENCWDPVSQYVAKLKNDRLFYPNQVHHHFILFHFHSINRTRHNISVTRNNDNFQIVRRHRVRPLAHRFNVIYDWAAQYATVHYSPAIWTKIEKFDICSGVYSHRNKYIVWCLPYDDGKPKRIFKFKFLTSERKETFQNTGVNQKLFANLNLIKRKFLIFFFLGAWK